MFVRRLVLLLLASLLLLPVPCLAETWQRFTCPEGRFSVELPGTPEVTTCTRSTPLGAVVENRFAVRLAGGESDVVTDQDLPGLAVFFSGCGGIVCRAHRPFWWCRPPTRRGLRCSA